jgi:hypothetical protein
VQALAGVFFEVQAGDADSLADPVRLDVDPAKLGQRLVVLRNLVALGQVGIEVIFPRENRGLIDSAIQRHRRQRGELHGFLVQHGQSPRQSQAHRANVRIRRIAKPRRAGAENLGHRQQLDVHFQPDHRLELGGSGNGSLRRGSHIG